MKNNKLLKLQKFDTPTICNGLELLDPKYKIKGYSKEKFFCLSPKIKPMIGYAKTAKISSLKHNKKTKNSLHIINAPSPAATASLAIADEVVSRIID